MSELIPINEIFGPTIQGEGLMIGSPTVFIRTQGCDMACEWCDSKYALPRISPEGKRMSVEQIVDTVEDLRVGVEWVTISGGNPAIHDLGLLVRELQNIDLNVALETQGTVYKTWIDDCDIVAVSPKPPSSGLTFSDLMWHNLDRFMALEQSFLKVVISGPEDMEFLRTLVRKYDTKAICVQPCNMVGVDTTESLLRKLSDLASSIVNDQELGKVLILPQLHVLMYGNKRGV